MHSNRQVIIFVGLLTVVVGFVLTLLYTSLADIHKRNELLFSKKAVLASVEDYLSSGIKEMSDEEIVNIFETKVEQKVINHEGKELGNEVITAAGYLSGLAEEVDMSKEEKKPIEDRLFPLFIFNADNGEKVYITSVRGNGLWDKIWGNIALKSDFNTVAGVSFDHAGETPGLGAEIKDNPAFKEQFKGKKIREENGDFVSILVRKGGARESNIMHEVDGITGATITADGVSEMLDKGLRYYEPYFDKNN